MIKDLQVSFTDIPGYMGASIVGAAGTYVAPNTIVTGPLGVYLSENSYADTLVNAGVNAGIDWGASQRLQLYINWIVPPAGGTSVAMQLITSANASLISPTVIVSLGVQSLASIIASPRQKIAMPSSNAYQAYLGLQAVTVGTFTAGAFSAGLVLDADSPVRGYANSFSVK